MNQLATTTALTPPEQEPAMLGFLRSAMANPDFPVEKFTVVLDAYTAQEAKMAEREFNRAMAVAQSDMAPIRKDAINPHTNSKYARFEAIDEHLRPIYTRNGFSVRFRTEDAQPGWVKVVCVIAHAAGHVEEFPLSAPLDSAGSQGRSNKTGVQAIGSTTSYLKRYLLTMAFNVALAGDDDDGEGPRRQETPRRTEWAGATSSARQGPRPAARPAAAAPRREAAPPKPPPTMDETLKGDTIPNEWPAAGETTDEYPDELKELLAEVEAMDLDRIDALGEDGEWMGRVRALFPPDLEVLRQAVRDRRDGLRAAAQ